MEFLSGFFPDLRITANGIVRYSHFPMGGVQLMRAILVRCMEKSGEQQTLKLHAAVPQIEVL